MKRALALLFAVSAAFATEAADKSIVLIAGTPSHGKAEHEFRAGALLLSDCLAKIPGIRPTVVSNGWPTDVSVLLSADAVLLFADGGSGHPAIKPERLKLLDGLTCDECLGATS